MSERFDVYVAHDAGDAAAAEALCAALEARGARVAAGVLLAPGDVIDGLGEAQRHSRLTAALVGGGPGDHYTLDAVARAVAQVGEGRHTVVPVILPAAQGQVPFGLLRVVPLEVGPGGMDAVAEALAARLRLRRPAAAGALDGGPPVVEEAGAGGGGGRGWAVGVAAAVVAGAVGLWLWVGDGPGDGRRAGHGRLSVDAGRVVEGGAGGRDAAVEGGQGEAGQRGVEQDEAGQGQAGQGGGAGAPPDAVVERRPAPPPPPPDAQAAPADAGAPRRALSGAGRCGDDRSCALRGPGAEGLRRDDVVCLTDRRARGPTCVVDAAGAVVKCDRHDRFQREPLGEVSWVLCPE